MLTASSQVVDLESCWKVAKDAMPASDVFLAREVELERARYYLWENPEDIVHADIA